MRYIVENIKVSNTVHSRTGRVDTVLQRGIESDFLVVKGPGETLKLTNVILMPEEVERFNALFSDILHRAMSTDGPDQETSR